MSLLDRYILKEWLKVFGMALGAMLGLLVIGEMYDSIPEFLRWGTPTGRVLEYYVRLVPGMLPIVLPVSLLVSMLFLLGHLHKNQEITAMRAAGLSLRRITRPLWFAGAVATATLALLNSVVIPDATEGARNLKESAEYDHQSQAAGKASASNTSVLFVNGRDNRRWRIHALDAKRGVALGVHVYELDASGAVRRQVFAREAKYLAAPGHWVFQNGRDFTYTDGGREIPVQEAFREKSLPAYTESPRHMVLLTKKPSALSLGEIDTLLSLSGDADSARSAAFAVRYHSILASPFACLIVVGLAIPFAVAGVRTNPMVGVSKAVGVFILYYLTERIGYALGSQQVIPPVLAAWIPNLLALAFAIRLCRRVD